ncbi:hypothetical protein D3C73_1327850 [compost metagenome]
MTEQLAVQDAGQLQHKRNGADLIPRNFQHFPGTCHPQRGRSDQRCRLLQVNPAALAGDDQRQINVRRLHNKRRRRLAQFDTQHRRPFLSGPGRMLVGENLIFHLMLLKLAPEFLQTIHT